MDKWLLFWAGGAVAAEGGGGLAGWGDLEAREAEAGFRDRQPILVSPDGRVDPRLSRFFRESKFAVLKPGTQESYAPDYRLFFTFLSGRGRGWAEATADDVSDWEDWRRRGAGNPRPVGGARWGRELAALKLLYDWAADAGHVTGNPVRARLATLTPVDVKYSNVKWLTPAAFRTWRNVGLGGMLPSGLEDESFRGRSDGRDMAFADLLYSSALRRREAGTLLLAELPDVTGRNYYSARVGAAVAKRAGRYFYVSHSAMQAVNGYRAGQRSAAIRRAQAAGRYEQIPGRLVVQEVSRRGGVLYLDTTGRRFDTTMDLLDHGARARMFVHGEGGLEPAMLWVTEAGMPMAYKGWTKVFERGSDRCERLGVKAWATPHMLRHSAALRMLIALNNALDRRLGLSERERRHYVDIYDGVWSMVKDLLGHRSEETTREVYLEPVRGLQLESLLNDDDNPVDERVLSEIAAKTGLVLDRV